MQKRNTRRQRSEKKTDIADQVNISEKYWFILYYAGIRLHRLMPILHRSFGKDEIWYPVYKINKYNYRKSKFEIRYMPFYPNYVFILTSLKTVCSEISCFTERMRFVKMANKYYAMNQEEIDSIKQLEIEMETRQEVEYEAKFNYKKDDIVKILYGPFKNCLGRVVDTDMKDRLKVVIIIFGREIEIILDIICVEKNEN